MVLSSEKDPAIRVDGKKNKMTFDDSNRYCTELVGDILFRLDLFSIKMKREMTIIAAKKMRIGFMVIGINWHGFDRCYWAFR